MFNFLLFDTALSDYVPFPTAAATVLASWFYQSLRTFVLLLTPSTQRGKIMVGTSWPLGDCRGTSH